MDQKQTHVKAHTVKKEHKKQKLIYLKNTIKSYQNQLMLTQLATDNFSSSNE